MRIAAGVLLLVVSVIHGCAGSGLMLIGSCTSTVGKGIETVTHDTGKLQATTRDLERTGEGFMLIGALLVLVMGLQIAGGVLLFSNRSPGFILAAGIAGVVIDLIVLALALASDRKNGEHSVNLYLSVVGGIVASALAIASSRTMEPANATPEGAR